MKNVAVVVIAYNREASLNRLLSSLDRASYPAGREVPLIISIDKSDNGLVADIAEAFEWKYGTKEIIKRETNLGLKMHVLSCGDFAEKYDGIIMLEDDLIVSPAYYSYAVRALEFSDNQDNIGGISLYNHLLNVHVREPFTAIDDGYDNYYFQFASSWGQAYSDKQWRCFREWLKTNDNEIVEAENIPANVSSWSDKSWLKYNIKYLVDTNKYFLYPRVSLTSNFMDEGTHSKTQVADLQVPLMVCRDREYNFSTVDESMSVYDAFFENRRLSQIIEKQLQSEVSDVRVGNIVIDLYGYKPVPDKFDVKYMLSSRPLPYIYVKSYGRCMRPLEANIINDIEGEELFLYDISSEGDMPQVNKALRYLYNYRAINKREMFEILKYRFMNRNK